jgi:NAD(P)H-flavin reductase
MMKPAQATTVYVFLPDEAVDVWRPVSAEHIRDDVYRIVGEPPDPEDEKWQFQPGQHVRCRLQQLDEGEFLVAYEADRA